MHLERSPVGAWLRPGVLAELHRPSTGTRYPVYADDAKKVVVGFKTFRQVKFLST